MARVLRWGPGYTGGEDPLNLLRDVIDAEEIRLDRWTVVFHPEDKPEDAAQKTPSQTTGKKKKQVHQAQSSQQNQHQTAAIPSNNQPQGHLRFAHTHSNNYTHTIVHTHIVFQTLCLSLSLSTILHSLFFALALFVYTISLFTYSLLLLQLSLSLSLHFYVLLSLFVSLSNLYFLRTLNLWLLYQYLNTPLKQ